MHPARVLFLIAVVITSTSRATPHGLPETFLQNFYKRSRLVVNGNRPDKREFNADDLTLRFGKRGMELHPSDLTLRFEREQK
ncbi:unnamed protein product [Cylicocyclus nassatus]|uniref:Uncharacterized protein n=1 Tax=Cylicocyclus nassatus TaxID=53992 RepID=A0AA36HF39_CYLNA|nr:unnamed protein product [Cylicocyclus nassatus]